MAHKRKRIFDGLYAQLEETDGNVVLFSARGEPSVIFEITNPVQQLCTDAQQYMLFHDVLSNILQTIGEGYALQKQDILCRQAYHHDVPDDAEFLTRSYFRYFEGHRDKDFSYPYPGGSEEPVHPVRPEEMARFPFQGIKDG